jgi:hypothetical protein
MGTVAEPIEKFGHVGGLQQGVVNPTTVASATTMPAPTHAITTVSGTVEIVLITLPWNGFTGRITYLPTGAFTGAIGTTATATAKPIGKAFTAVAGKALDLVFDGTLWYPSYTS